VSTGKERTGRESTGSESAGSESTGRERVDRNSAETGLDRPHVFLPADPTSACAPLLLLHGTGGDEHDLLPLRDRLSPGAAVLSVRGTVLENGMPRFFRRLREGVFDEDDLRRRADDLAEFILAASAAYGIDARSLVAVGFSNGANIASAMLLRRPGVVGAAVLLAGTTPFAEPPEADLAGTLVVVSNGRRDAMVPWAAAQRLVAQFRERGAEVVELHHAGGHRLDPGVLPQISNVIERPEREPGAGRGS
jgi:phospholipase/carboxylesterase